MSTWSSEVKSTPRWPSAFIQSHTVFNQSQVFQVLCQTKLQQMSCVQVRPLNQFLTFRTTAFKGRKYFHVINIIPFQRAFFGKTWTTARVCLLGTIDTKHKWDSDSFHPLCTTKQMMNENALIWDIIQSHYVFANVCDTVPALLNVTPWNSELLPSGKLKLIFKLKIKQMWISKSSNTWKLWQQRVFISSEFKGLFFFSFFFPKEEQTQPQILFYVLSWQLRSSCTFQLPERIDFECSRFQLLWIKHLAQWGGHALLW